MSRSKLLLCFLASLTLALPTAGIPLISGAAAKSHHKKKHKKHKKPSCKVSLANGQSVGATVSGTGGTPTYSLKITCTNHTSSLTAGGIFSRFTVTTNKHVQSPTAQRQGDPSSVKSCTVTGPFSYSCTLAVSHSLEGHDAVTGFTSTDPCPNGGFHGTVTVQNLTKPAGGSEKYKTSFTGTCS